MDARPSDVLELDEASVVDYRRTRTELLDDAAPVDVRAVIGGPDGPEEEGFVNFLFRVRQGERSWIVMEDLNVADLRPLRFRLIDGARFPLLAGQVSSFLADNHFFTSELFLDKETFRELQADFANPSMRAVMEDVVLTRLVLRPDGSTQERLGTRTWQERALRLELVRARDVLIHKSECLVHGDLHTSNLFVDETSLRVIDMEYAFVGPFSFDLGYLLANFVSQFAALEFNSRFTPAFRRDFQRYLLATVQQILDGYFARFAGHFAAHAKPLYRDTVGYLDDHLFPTVLDEAIAFTASANLHRIANLAPFPDFDQIPDDAERLLAQALSMAIDEHLLRHHARLTTPALLVEAITTAQDAYRRSLRAAGAGAVPARARRW